jgi:hypothetical protein
MRRVLKGILILPLSQLLIMTTAATSSHVAELKSKFPYGLLSDDYGILTINDLALNACHIKPTPFVPGVIHPYEYWLCFKSKTVSAACEDTHSSNEDGHIGWVRVKAQDDQLTYDFTKPRPWAIRMCRDFVKSLKNLIRGTSHTCISASYISKEEINEKGQRERLGELNRLKTRKGCEGAECLLTEEIRRDFCPNLKL